MLLDPAAARLDPLDLLRVRLAEIGGVDVHDERVRQQDALLFERARDLKGERNTTLLAFERMQVARRRAERRHVLKVGVCRRDRRHQLYFSRRRYSRIPSTTLPSIRRA